MVAALVRASKAVVICPKDDEEVARELDIIAREDARSRTIYLADPDVSPAASEALFARLAPAGEAPDLPKLQTPIAAFVDPKHGWRILTTSKPACVQTYVVALNMALQAVLGQANPSRISPRTREEFLEALTAYREGRRVTVFKDG
jgi:hypothetical protein